MFRKQWFLLGHFLCLFALQFVKYRNNQVKPCAGFTKNIAQKERAVNLQVLCLILVEFFPFHRHQNMRLNSMFVAESNNIY